MSALLLDASVWLAARDRDDPFHDDSRALIVSRSTALSALDLTLYEIANVATVRWGSPAEARRLVKVVLKACDHLARANGRLLEAASGIAAKHSITVYDAAYVAVAEHESLSLVSADLKDLVGRGLAISPSDAGSA